MRPEWEPQLMDFGRILCYPEFYCEPLDDDYSVLFCRTHRISLKGKYHATHTQGVAVPRGIFHWGLVEAVIDFHLDPFTYGGDDE